ncbi:MAG: oxygen-independent coproporphyrinogen III oxidase [Oligoflexus sp.]
MPAITYNQDFLRRYTYYGKLALPRHTSYPTAPHWQDLVSESIMESMLCEDAATSRSLSLYLHIPFCQSLCYYCGCTKMIRPERDAKTTAELQLLISGLKKEIRRKAKLLPNRHVQHIHFGGGTPSYLHQGEWLDLWQTIRDHFQVADDAEIAIELDPRTIGDEDLSFLQGLGFNRISMGIQDFDLKVQKAVNRLQSFEQVQLLTNRARQSGFHSINFDLIYGLPFQSPESMSKTLEQVIKLQPDRIAYYRLAVMPEIFKWQRSFIREDLPQGEASLKLQILAMERFQEAGYEFIGLDHFAKPHDDLAIAFHEKRLSRNFQGMTAGRDQHLIGFGPSAISSLQTAYWQNPKKLNQWWQQATDSKLAMKGCLLSQDDLILRRVIAEIYCYGKVDLPSIADEYQLDAPLYFQRYEKRMKKLIEDGLLRCKDGVVSEEGLLGRLLRRVIASSFDAYLPEDIFEHGLASNQASRVG